jgi:hypothetical protein
MSSLDIAYEKERTKRMFIGQVGALFGIDQSLASTDAAPVNYPGQYAVYGGAGYALEGQPVSQAQNGASLLPVLLLVAGVLVLWKLAK